MSKKFLLSQSATTKVAIGLATIGGIGAVGHHVINQAIDSQAEAKEQSNNKDVTGLNAFSEVLLPKKVSSILDSPIGPVDSNIFESDKKVELSSLNLENSIRVEDETIPFETEIKYKDDKPSNYVNLIQEGSNGSHTTTFIDSFDENGKLIQSVKTLEENEEPRKQIIEIGTKNIEQTDEVNTPAEIISNGTNSNVELESKTIIETIPKETIYTIDENLSKDESYTIKGEDGQKEVTTNTVSVNGVDVHKEVVHEEVVNPAVHDVTYISEEAYNKKVASQDLKEIKVEETTEATTENITKPNTENTTEVTTESTTEKASENTKEEVSPNTTEKVSPNTTEKVTPNITEETTEHHIKEREVTKEERNTAPKVLKFKTTVIEDENLLEGQVSIEQLGVNGSEYDVYQDTFVDGNLVSSTIIRTVTTEPVNQIERHGTKKDETKGPGPNEEVRETLHEDKRGIPGAESVQKIVKETTTKDLKIDVVYDETLPEGTEEVLEEGKAETTEITYKITSVNDEVISKEKMNEEITQQAVARVVKRGTGKTTKSYDNTITKIPFETETIQDNTLLPEESYTKQEGLPGSEVTEYELTYMNSKLVSKEVTSTHRIKEPTKEIKVVGTKVAQNTTSNNYQSGAVKNGNVVDLGKTRDITLKQGLADDDVLPNGITVRYFTITDNTPLEKIVTLSEDERYQKSDKEYYNSMIVSHNGSYIESGIPLSQGGADYINEHLDSNLLAMYMEQHINELRASLGKKPLRYKAELQQGTRQRADEQAKIGSLRSGGRAHTRPDGTEFRTAFTYLNKGGLKDKEQELGENTAQFSSNNLYTLTSEKRIAETLFNYWKNSPGHYANMISDNYKYFSFAASVGRASANMDEYSELYPVIMGVQVFQ